MPATRSQILRLMDKLEVPMLKEFRNTIAQIRSRSQLARLITAIENGDLEAAFRAAGMREGQWSTLAEQIRSAYVESGIFSVAADVPTRFGMTFNITNPRAEEWLRFKSSAFVTRMNADQREAVQEMLQSGMARGRNPRTTALDIIGRVSGRTGRRTGGVLGLNGPQTNAVINARQQLNNLDSSYFTRIRRDRRYDNMVREAIRSGTPLTDKQVNTIIGRYEDRLLQTRGETIARTETLEALNEASDEALRQVIDDGLAPPDAVVRVWQHSFSGNERKGHLEMHGQERGIDEPFYNPETGVELMHPGEGPASEVINCRCIAIHRINFSAVENAA